MLLCIFVHIRSHKTQSFESTTKPSAPSRAFLVSVVSGRSGQAPGLCVSIHFSVPSTWECWDISLWGLLE
uniref:Uncharacterized protein n=1 Tax=Melopsittacus undulatus TaxID=13146 RepID=A0A8C6ITW0_MELUD